MLMPELDLNHKLKNTVHFLIRQTKKVVKHKLSEEGKKATMSSPTPKSLGYLSLTTDLYDFGKFIESKNIKSLCSL